MGGRDAALEQEVLHLDQHIRHEPYCSIMFGVKKAQHLEIIKKKKNGITTASWWLALHIFQCLEISSDVCSSCFLTH